MITLTIPNDDTIALRQFGRALIEIASEKDGHPVDVTITPLVISTDVEERLRAATETLQQAAPQMMDELRFEGEELQGKRKEPEFDATGQQYEALQEHVKTKHIELVASPFIDTDSTGTPWDERIHSTTRVLNANGTWRLRRKPKDMDEEQWAAFIQNVQDELLCQKPDDNQHGPDAGGDLKEIEQKSNENNNIAPAEVEPPVTLPGDDFHTDAGVVTEQTVAGIPPLPVPPPVALPGSTGATDLLPPPPVGTAVTQPTWDFPRLMTFLTERHGKIDVATVNTLLAQDGMSSVQELNAHPDKIGPFVARVKAHLGE